ncbi:hypothetical protein AB0D29_10320 [Streptomyces sp. NPDC048424]|uniref:hypothetical protein n=1 Tax=Streptomyces sp. NPDC048424 TaxID=3155265 RepID=UPI00343744E9
MAGEMRFENTEMSLTTEGIVLGGLYGWPGWVVEADIYWPTWSAREIRDIAPPGTRSNARRPCDDAELVTRIRGAAEACREAPRSSIWLLSLGFPTPHKKRPNGPQLRAATIATMYDHARHLGLSPRRAISEVYALPVIDEGKRTEYSRKLERWIERARKTVNPETGRPYLPAYESELHAPRQWPIGRHPLEPRRARPALPEPVREGPYAGRTLTLKVTRTSPPEQTAREVEERGERIGPDLIVEGRWSDGKELPPLPPLQADSPGEMIRRVQALVKELEGRYPGAKVTAKGSQGDRDLRRNHRPGAVPRSWAAGGPPGRLL